MLTTARARATRSAQKTITRFLNAAEEEFGKYGYEGTTIRAIASRARVNLGTLQHYWGSKRELFHDLLERRFRPLHQEHLRRLRAIEAEITGGGRPDVREVLRTLIEPTFLLGSPQFSAYDPDLEKPAARQRLRALYGRAMLDPSPHVVSEMNRLFEDSIKLFLSLMRRAFPDLPPAELDWRVNCIIGAQVLSLVYGERVGRFIGPEVEVESARASEWILHFFMNGINAPPFGETGRRA
jgi:AcrR family transcriptional regulator